MFLGAKSSTIQRVFTRNGKSMTISSLFLFSLLFVLFLPVFSFPFSFSFIFSLFFLFLLLFLYLKSRKKKPFWSKGRGHPPPRLRLLVPLTFSLSRPLGVISTLRNLRPSHMLSCEVVSFTRSRSCFASATLHLIQSLSLSPVHPDQHSCI